jgi:hypothetical protein
MKLMQRSGSAVVDPGRPRACSINGKRLLKKASKQWETLIKNKFLADVPEISGMEICHENAVL